MKLKLIIFILSLILIIASSESESESNTQKTQEEMELEYEKYSFIKEVSGLEFLEYSKRKEFTFVLFYYIEKTHYCRKIFDILNEIQYIFKENKINILKINARLYENLFFSLKFKLLPGLILLNNDGTTSEIYENEQTKEELTLFLKKRTSPLVKIMNLSSEIEEFYNKNEVVLIEIGVNIPSLSFINVSKRYGFIFFGACNTLDCFQTYNKDLYNEVIKSSSEETPISKSPNRIILLNKQNNNPNEILYIDTNQESIIEEFIDSNAHPIISEVNERSLHRMMKSGKETFILFDNKEKENFHIYEQASTKLSTYGFILIYSDPSQTYSINLMNHFGVTSASLPTFLITKRAEKQEIYKYNYNPLLFNREKTELTKQILLNFAHDWKYDLIKPVPLSLPIPLNPYNDYVYQLVGHNFIEVISDTSKAVLVKFYSAECKYCKEFSPTYNELARVLQPMTDLIIAEVDVKENFVPIRITSLPTVLLFTKEENKKNLIYEFDRNLMDLIRFVRFYSNAEFKTIDEEF